MYRVEKVIGNPGTGKTTYLLDRVAEAILCGVDPSEIVYLTFTRKAIQEARERVLKVTGVPASAFKYFKTLHSMSYHMLGVKHGETLSKGDITFLMDQAGIGHGVQKSYMVVYNRAKTLGVSFMKALDETDRVDMRLLSDFEELLLKFKAATGKVSVSDLLDLYIKNPLIPKIKMLLVDEAQDLSARQWEMVRILCSGVVDDGVVYIAGDPHQAIYEWAGADVETFLSFAGAENVLEQSYRIPKKVYDLSRVVLSKFTDPDRFPYKPMAAEGSIKVYGANEYNLVPIGKEGSWMVLAHNWHNLSGIMEYMTRAGILWRTKIDTPETDRVIRCIRAYARLLVEGSLHGNTVKMVQRYVSLPLEHCIRHQLHWKEVFDGMERDRVHYYEAILRDTGVNVSTIHAVKGGEADNVLILGDLGDVNRRAYLKDKTQHYRTLYVALTRAGKNLHLMMPQTAFGYQWAEYMKEAGLENDT